MPQNRLSLFVHTKQLWPVYLCGTLLLLATPVAAYAMETSQSVFSGIGITDDQLNCEMGSNQDLSLKLSHNPITDVGIANLLKNPTRLHKLDLSDVSTDGSALVSSNCPTVLKLDRTIVTDANLVRILNMRICNEISIRETGISAAVLPYIASYTNFRLTLGVGLITEQDLANLPPGTSFSHLGLNDKKFTGECLRAGNIRVHSLDLSHSGVTDKSLQSLPRSNYLYLINLSHTDITDVGIASLNCNEVDVRQTSVTAEGIRNASQCGRILIDHNQFTPEELVSLRNSNIAIDGEATAYGW